jgi:tetratricopeptide (TPR) repeat protein
MDRNNDEKQIISYLLGELEEDDRRQVEERLFTSDEYFDLLLVSEDDLIDDYVKSRLSAREREKFETHFLSTPERRERLRFAMAFRQHIEREDKPVIRPEWWRRLFSVPSLGFVAAAIILLALGVGIWRVFIYESELSKGLVALNKAYSAERPVEARISKLDYAPFPVTRGDEQRAVDKLSLKRAEGKIVDEAEQAPNAASLHALGKLYLTEKKFDEAIEQLEKALRIDDKKAQLHSDLGAALLEKGKIDRSKGEGGKSLEEFARSLEHLNRALELDGSLLEALFNRALLYHYMLLPDQEAEAWRAYLAKDSNSRWADEAREKLKRLEEKKVARLQTDGKLLPDFIGAFQSTSDDTAYELIRKNTEPITRQLLWWELLGAYLDLTGKGESDGASLYLQALSYAGGLQKQRSGDQFVSELARFYESSTLERQALLSQAHALINQANALLARSGTDMAFELYEGARRIFDKTGDQLESQFADYYIGYCLYRKSDFKRSLTMLSQVAEYSRARGYLWLSKAL